MIYENNQNLTFLLLHKNFFFYIKNYNINLKETNVRQNQKTKQILFKYSRKGNLSIF